MRKLLKASTALCLAGCLAACGGDGDNNGTSENNATSGANASTAMNVSTNANTGTNNPTGVEFRSEDPSEYTRIDAVGQPFVTIFFVPEASRDGYNDQLPNVADYDAAVTASLTEWHAAFDDELANFALPPCSMEDSDGDGLADCLGQDFGGGLSAADLIRPDAIRILDSTAPAGYPNGRMLSDPVADIMFSILLIDQQVADPDTLVGVLNPATNDVADGSFPESFPYLHPPHE